MLSSRLSTRSSRREFTRVPFEESSNERFMRDLSSDAGLGLAHLLRSC
jgi:hypothetical protein